VRSLQCRRRARTYHACLLKQRVNLPVGVDRSNRVPHFSLLEKKLYAQTPRQRKQVSAEQIAEMADRGESISRFFTNSGKMMQPIQRVNVDFTVPMLKELDEEARALNISRQAVIKSLLRQALDQQRLARRVR